MSSRRQRSIPLGGRYRQVSLYYRKISNKVKSPPSRSDDFAIFYGMTSYGILKRPPFSRVNILRPSQNGRHFARDIFKCIFLKEEILISIDSSQKFGQINDNPSLVQIMA